jgi:hypothetical protein
MTPAVLKREIVALFQVVKDRGNDEEICIVCPVPGCQDKTGNRFINIKNLYTNCYRCQEPQPHHLRSLFRVVGHEFTDDRVMEVSELGEALRQGGHARALTPVQDIALPHGFERLSEHRQSCYWDFCRHMAERKHLGIEDLEAADAGFVREGIWEPYCIFPVYEGKRTVYYQGRTYSDEGYEQTKRFPSKKEVPYGMRYWVYNLDALEAPGVCVAVVVESILNALSLRRKFREEGLKEFAPVCVFTHRLSRAQVLKLKRYRRIKEFCILFDSDSTGLASVAALSLETALPTSVARMPHGVNPDGSARRTNDANDDVEAALKAIVERQPPRDHVVFFEKCTQRTTGAAGHLGL